MFVLELKKKDKVLVVKWDSIDKHASKKKTFNGKWSMDPKCGHAKMKLFMLNCQQQLFSNNLILVKQWKTSKSLFNLPLISTSQAKVSQ
jgi:hypothetical protein